MQIERFLSRTEVIVTIIAIEDIFSFCGKFSFNSIVKIPKVLQDLDNPRRYWNIGNILPDFKIIKEFSSVYLTLLITIIVVLAILNIYTAYKMKVAWSEEYFNIGQKGDSRWTTNEEIKEQYEEIPDRDVEFPGQGGTIISRMGKKLYIDRSPVNNLIIGITRSGKDEMYVFPEVDEYSRAEIKTSLIVNDPKLETYKSSKKKHWKKMRNMKCIC